MQKEHFVLERNRPQFGDYISSAGNFPLTILQTTMYRIPLEERPMAPSMNYAVKRRTEYYLIQINLLATNIKVCDVLAAIAITD